MRATSAGRLVLIGVRRHALLVILLGCRLALGLAYSAAIPPWEGVDEDAHFAYAQYLAAHGHLLGRADSEAAAIRESHQPPLYYALIALLLAPAGAAQPYPQVTLNPYLPYGAGYNHAIQPLQPDETALSLLHRLYAARALTTVLVTASALAVYAAARRLWPEDVLAAGVATALFAFWPQGLYLSSVVNNDALALAGSALVLYAAFRMAQDGARPGNLLLLGGSLALAILTKLNGLALLVPAGLAVGWGSLRAAPQRRGRLWLTAGLVGALCIGTLVWVAQLDFVRAQVLQIQTLNAFIENAGRDRWLGFGLVLPGLAHALRSSLGEFGWGNIYLPEPLYGLWGGALAVAILGLADSFFESRTRLSLHVVAVLVGQLLAVLGLALALGVAVGSGYIVLGRYLLPALPAVALLWVGGWRSLGPGRWPRVALKALGIGIVLTAWCVPWLTLAPAYARPVLLEPGAVVTHLLNVTFGDSIELIGHEEVTRTPTAGTVAATLCWGAVRPIERDYAIQLDAIDADGRIAGTFTTFPGHGTYPTTHWQAGARFCETYEIMGHDTTGPVSPAAIRISVLDELTREHLSGHDHAGASLTTPLEIRVP